MERNITKNLLSSFSSKVAVMAFSASMLLTSCVVYTGGYSETDGVYYDPNTDTLPAGYGMVNSGNEVGEYYDYQDTGVIQKNNQIQAEKNNKYRNSSWSNNVESNSDWGNFAGNVVNYNDWGWDTWGFSNMYSPFYGGMYSPWHWGYGYGMGMGYWGSAWNWGPSWSIGWGRPWGWNIGMSWGWGNPWYGGMYSPWNWGYGYGYGMGYWGYSRPRYTNMYPNRPSGQNGLIHNNNVGGRYGNSNRVPGINSTTGSRNPGVQSGNRVNQNGVNGNRQPQVRPNGNINQRVPQQNRDSYRTNSNDNFRNNGGFRDNGSSNSNYRSGGGFNSGGNSGFGGGSSRSGGGMSGGSGMRGGGR